MLDEIVRGYVVAVAESARAAGRLERLISEVEVFQVSLFSSEGLRLALTDSGLATIDRQGIVADLLVGRALDETADLVRFVLRIVRAGDVPVTVAEVGQLLSIVRDSSEVALDADAPAGRVGARRRIRGYAERVLQEVTAPTDLDEVEDELFRFARVLEDNPALRRVLEDTNYAVSSRVDVLTDLIGARVQASTLRLGSYVLRAGRLRNLAGTYDWLVELVAEERGRRIADVRSCVALSEAETERLAVALRRLVGREVEVRVVIDPSVIGGIMISTGDLFIDGTVRLRFERLRDQFAEQV